MSASVAGEPNAPMVAATAIVRRHGPVLAVGGISFTVARGEMFGLIGPDGAGKTTTLRMVLGLLHPDSGTLRTAGFDPVTEPRAVAVRTGYLSQRFSLYGDLSVDENIAFFAEVHGVRRWQPRRDELLALLRLEPFRKRLAERLSGGMKQKLALACTLIHTPELLVLDEPTTGVDPVSRRDFWRILARLQKDGLTILLTTPYLDEAERCQRVALIDGGRLLKVDRPDAIRGAARGTIVEIIARPRRAAIDRLRSLPGVSSVESFGERLHVTLAEGPDVEGVAMASTLARELAAAGLEVESARPVQATLEDVFIAMLQGWAA